MKTQTTAALVLTSIFTVSSIAFAVPENNSPNTNNSNSQHAKKNLNLTQKDVKTLVQAALIKHNKSDLTIQKINEIDLVDGNKFYLVYVAETSKSTAVSFLVVDAQSGRMMPFPKPKHGRKHHQGNNNGDQSKAMSFSDTQ